MPANNIPTVRPCDDEYCWKGGKAIDCVDCEYAKRHPNVIVLKIRKDTNEEDRRDAA